jgi:hypothetical protein
MEILDEAQHRDDNQKASAAKVREAFRIIPERYLPSHRTAFTFGEIRTFRAGCPAAGPAVVKEVDVSLEIFRATLTLRLLSSMAFNQGEEGKTLESINLWWGEYKAWEGRDRFVTAVREGRMTMRQGPPDAFFYGEYLGRQMFPGNFSARHGNVEKVDYPNERIRVGFDSLKERLDPSNFGIDQGERLKYKKGLHDLSGSLVTSTIKLLTNQVRWKWGKLSEWITIFMPMAQPEDIQLFALLNSMAKEARAARPAIYNRVVELRKRMTRIKFADSQDFKSGMLNVGTNERPKLKYGPKGAVDENGKLTGEDLLRYKKALDYRSILPTDGRDTNMNEIVISYREHEGTRFPVFTKWDSKAEAFLCLPDEPSSKSIVDGKIPNDWTQTVEFG